MFGRVLSVLAISLVVCSVSHAQLLIDFNSTNQDGGPHNDSEFQAYDAGHETPADVGEGTDPGATKTYSAFGTTISLTPDWPNTTDVRVRQSIDRTSQSGDPPTGFDASWQDGAVTDLSDPANPVLGLNLVTDFLGTDTRTGNGGNGDWDGTTGTPTFMTLTLGDLPANTYSWTSAHQDTEHVHGTFAVWVSTDGGSNFNQLPDGVMTDGSTGGSPDSGAVVVNTAEMAAAGSIYNATFTADGTNDVVMQFAPYSGDDVHKRIWGIDGFVLDVVPEPASAWLLLLAFCGGLGFLRRRK